MYIYGYMQFIYTYMYIILLIRKPYLILLFGGKVATLFEYYFGGYEYERILWAQKPNLLSKVGFLIIKLFKC